ncbi:protein FAR1-RELATED SEQUENCE 5-like [Papaver somniferum]|uniref:protein FAR1-RELATED SEQUENCE 5-like n=1 Tax=Papaver somniferum TaxID=3469 RepID=UPI000E701AA2|nr:protein FAR1-RELATED SEQUENCE 5-like [Papaver somniferum]
MGEQEKFYPFDLNESSYLDEVVRDGAQEKHYSVDSNEIGCPSEVMVTENGYDVVVRTNTEDISVIEEATGDDITMIGKIFKSEDDAYEFYNVYARSVGFSVRKHWASKRKVDKKIIGRTFCCSCEGQREKHTRGTPTKPRGVTRTGCMARMQIKINDNENYYVVEFLDDHNHELASSDKVHLLRSQRKMLPAQATLINNMISSGFGATRIFSYMSEEAGGPQNLNFTQEDCNNLVQGKRIEWMKAGDAQLLLDYFQAKQKENKSFFYTIQPDEEDRIMNIFWCDAKSRLDYSAFGDVVCFDTTFKTNGYDLPFAPIFGVNNHGQTILFGSALLKDESTRSFLWLFETFLTVMEGKEMKTIFTDHASQIANTIKQVFPNAHHRLCLWHIFQNAAKHLSHIFGIHESFLSDFRKCIYDYETEYEFRSSWEQLLEKYELKDDKWLNNLFKLREKWAQVYGREHFCAGMTTTQRSESINNYFKKYFKKKQILREFVGQFDKAVAARREKAKKADYKSMATRPNLTSVWEVEEKSSKIYTSKIFNEFQMQVKRLIDLEFKLDSDDGTTSIYKVSSYIGKRAPRTISDLPSEYYLKRWTKDASNSIVIDSQGNSLMVDCDPSLSARYSELSHLALSIATTGCINEEASIFVKQALLQVLKETKSLSTAQPNNVGVDREKNLLEISDEDEDLPQGNTTLKDPIRKKTIGESSARHKDPVEVGKRGKKGKKGKMTKNKK